MPHIEPIWFVVGLLAVIALTLFSIAARMATAESALSLINAHVEDVSKRVEAIEDETKLISSEVTVIGEHTAETGLVANPPKHPELF